MDREFKIEKNWENIHSIVVYTDYFPNWVTLNISVQTPEQANEMLEGVKSVWKFLVDNSSERQWLTTRTIFENTTLSFMECMMILTQLRMATLVEEKKDYPLFHSRSWRLAV